MRRTRRLNSRSVFAWAAFLMVWPVTSWAEQAGAPAAAPSKIVNGALQRIATLVEPAGGQPVRTFTTTLRVTKAEGLPKEFMGATVELALQAPDHAGIVAHVKGQTYAACRDGQEIWGHIPEKHFGVLGKAGVLRFAEDPTSIDHTVLPPLKLPINL